MKNNVLKYYITVFYLCSNVVMFAATTPGTNDDTGTLEDAEPAAPIDDYVWLLALLGLVFVFLRFRALAKQRNT